MEPRHVSERLALLRSLGVFNGLRDDELVAFDRCFTDVSVEAGHLLTEAGRRGHQAYVVVDGEANVSVGGRTITVTRGQMIGEMALLDDATRNATVTAATPMRLLAFDVSGLRTMLAHDVVAQKVMAELVQRVRTSNALG